MKAQEGSVRRALKPTKWVLACVLMVVWAVPFVAAQVAFDADTNPELASQFIISPQVSAQHYMVSSANPLASQAGFDILRRGGGAIDAAIATQLVLNLVEPQSSGIGGGAFIVYYDRLNDKLVTYDGRETAPTGVSDAMFLNAEGQLEGYHQAVNSGLSVGVPGLLRVLELAHQKHGLLPWEQLFEPAIQLAEKGFPVSGRLHYMLEHSRGLREQAATRAYFFAPDGQPWPVGHILKNPEFAHVLKRVAAEGPDAFYTGDVAVAIVDAVRNHERPGTLSLDDLANYQALERSPLCGQYRVYTVCGVGPPSSGTLSVLQILGVLQPFPVASWEPTSVEAVHHFSEAGRLAYADRDYYVADPASQFVPVKQLLDPDYLRQRLALIRADRSMGRAEPGDPAQLLQHYGADNALEQPSTSHISIVDVWGNVLSMTTTIEAGFGSKIWVQGFLLNNELTDFSLKARDEKGRLRANRIEPGKRPRSSMAPLIVFRDQQPYLAIGSPGGTAIINYVARTLVGVFDWGLGLNDAIALPHYGSRNGPTELENDRGLEGLVSALEAKGHDVRLGDFPSGLQGVLIDKGRLFGGSDPRREGLVLGH